LKRVVVVGAGVAGLTAAHYLAQRGAHVTVLEADRVAGGRIATREHVRFTHGLRVWDFPAEHGVHGVWRSYRNLRRLLGELALGHRLAPASRQELVAIQGGKIVHPEVGEVLRETLLPTWFSSLALARRTEFLRTCLESGPRSTARLLRDLLHVLAFDVRRDTSHYDALPVDALLRDWPPLIARLFESLTHQAFFDDASQVSLSAFLSGLDYYVTSDKRNTAFSLFSAAADEAWIDPWLSVLRARGVDVRLNSPVSALTLDSSPHQLSVNRSGEVERFDADAVVLALDPAALARLLGAQRQRVLGDARLPAGLASVVVRLWFRERPNASREASGIFAAMEADNFFWLDRFQRRFSAWSEATGGSALELHLYGDRARRAVTETDGAVLGRVRALVQRVWPELTGREVFAHVLRNPATHSAFSPGMTARLPTVSTRVPNLMLAGDFVQPPHVALYLERATMTGLDAARRVVARLGLESADLPTPLAPHPDARSMRVLKPLTRAALRWLPPLVAPG
jgi:carotenoid phi-ring synthase / carotenoid chi-ring synthase